jgi:DNA-binding transcriptional LysR family regulator
MNIKQLTYFCEVVDAGSASTAAHKLFIAPTAISMQISQLEALLGGKLFDRSSRPMSLTPLGRFLYPKAKELLSDANRLAEEAKGMASGNLGWLSIGFTRSTIFSVLPDAVRAMKSSFPKVQVDLVEILTEHQAESLRKGLIHLGISRTIGELELEPDLSYIPLFKEALVAAIPLQHRLARRKSLKASDLNEIPFISYPKDPYSSFSKLSLGLLEAAGARPRVGYEAKEIHTALGLVAAGLGATLVGQTVAVNNRTDVCFVPIRGAKMEAQVFAVRRKGEQSQLADAFLDIIQAQSAQRS